MKKARGQWRCNCSGGKFHRKYLHKISRTGIIAGTESSQEGPEKLFGQGVTGQLNTISLEVSDSGDLAWWKPPVTGTV